MRAFLGLMGYYRRFIPNYASVAAPLTDLTKKIAPSNVVWNGECDKAFKELKKLLCTSPVLRNPDFSRRFILQTDASDRGIGAVLSQKDEAGEEHPVVAKSFCRERNVTQQLRRSVWRSSRGSKHFGCICWDGSLRFRLITDLWSGFTENNSRLTR